MTRKDIRVDSDTKRIAKESKRPDETWDDWVRRVVQLERATRIEE